MSLYKRYPHTLAILRELNPGPPGDRLDWDADVRYASDDPASGAIEVDGVDSVWFFAEA